MKRKGTKYKYGTTRTNRYFDDNSKKTYQSHKKDCRNCVSYRYDKRFCKNFEIPISMTSTGEVCKNFSNKYTTKNAKKNKK